MFRKWFEKKGTASSSADNLPATQSISRADTADSEQRPAKKSRPRRKKQVAKSQWSLAQFQVPEKEGQSRFHDLELPLSIMHAIADLGFEYCSPIQQAVLPYTLDGYDAIGKAQTGTGKTAAFLLTALNDLLNNPIEDERFMAEPRVVVIAPTRELVMQIATVSYTHLTLPTILLV